MAASWQCAKKMCKAVQEGIPILSVVPKSSVGFSTAASLGDKELCHLHHARAMRNVKKPIDQMLMCTAIRAVRQAIAEKGGKSTTGGAVLPAIMLTNQRRTAWRRIMESYLEIGIPAGFGRIDA